MTTETPKPARVNPLTKYFRQPAIYITLPSGGKYWAEGALEMPETGEFPVYPMTNKDEITLRTPDALMNGQGVIDVIQSCFPHIKDAWKMPSVDVDASLIAMRIASYGHTMDFDSTCPHCKSDHTYTTDLRQMMAGIRCPDYEQPVTLGPITIRFQPQKYYDISHTNRTSFEIQKMQQAISTLPDELGFGSDEKMAAVSGQMQKVSELNQRLMASGTHSITLVDTGDVITDKDFIFEFYSNISAEMFKEVQTAMETVQEPANLKPMPVPCQTCNETFNLNIVFDYATFFATGS